MTAIITDEVYGAEYCKRINAKLWRFKTIPSVIEVFYNHFKPTSVIDLGCANGIHIKKFKELGVKRVLGLEGTKHWVPYIENAIGSDYVIKDLRKPLGIKEQFDLVFSVEVLEHLEKMYANQAVKNILSLGKVFCISACPISGGFHHFNPQPRQYWINKFAKHGAKYQQVESEYLQHIFSTMNCSGWFKDSLKIFRK